MKTYTCSLTNKNMFKNETRDLKNKNATGSARFLP